MSAFETPTIFLPGDRGVGRPELPVAHDVVLPDRGTTRMHTVEGPPGAPSVLLLHGWTVTAALNWFRVYRPLSTTYDVVSYDQRGHGGGIRPASRLRLRDLVDDAVAVLDALSIERAIVVGYSMGGTVAQLLARHHPHRVQGLVLAATWAHGPSSPLQNQLLRGSAVAGRALRTIPRRHQIRTVRAAWGRLAPTSPDDRPPWFVEQVVAGSFPHIVEAGRELARFDSRAWLPDLAMPTAQLITTRDQVVPPSRQHRLAAGLPGGELRRVPMDHDGCATDPDRFVPALLDLVDAVAAR
ncbi:MAG: alpha/beta hydrolase [Actinomycetota bacterium]